MTQRWILRSMQSSYIWQLSGAFSWEYIIVWRAYCTWYTFPIRILLVPHIITYRINWKPKSALQNLGNMIFYIPRVNCITYSRCQNPLSNLLPVNKSKDQKTFSPKPETETKKKHWELFNVYLELIYKAKNLKKKTFLRIKILLFSRHNLSET